ncbi:MAG: ABC transporter ATP-binding protein [Actinomycetales bacterium]|nr:ABC transporter ATP-binding protein [Actinomycetales bacterium]
MCAVGVRRATRWLLDGIDWQVRPGSRWVILGPNGAGKTTLLNIAAAQLFPTVGMVHILGEELGSVDVSELRTRIGWSSALLASEIPAEETVHNVVLTGAYAVTGRWREEYDSTDALRARGLVDEWGLIELVDRPFGTLSEGERKRCMVARSLMSDPELLILDEPAAGLDLAGREQLLDGLGRLAQDPTAPTMVLVTHHVEEIPQGFTDLLMLHAGTVSATGALDDTLSNESLSSTFGLRIGLHRAGNRYFAVQQGN